MAHHTARGFVQLQKRLDGLADKGLLMDFQNGGLQVYLLAPTMAGFFEFSLMRTDGRFDRRLLSRLYYDYINREEAFVRQVFGLQTPIDRVFVQEDMIREEDRALVLDYEKASFIIDSATCITRGSSPTNAWDTSSGSTATFWPESTLKPARNAASV